MENNDKNQDDLIDESSLGMISTYPIYIPEIGFHMNSIDYTLAPTSSPRNNCINIISSCR